MKDHVWKIIGVVAVLAIGASIVYSNSVSGKANEGVVFEAHIKGNAEATVTLTEYSDFQCPACGQFFPVIQDIMAEHGDSIAFEYKHFPLLSIHPFAVPAAKAAEAAGQQGKFFEMHDKLFENQQIWSAGAAPQPFFTKYAEELELDMDLFKRHLKASVINDKIQAEFEEARGLGLTSTPSFFLNGERMSFSTYEDFVNQITAAVNPEASDAQVAPTATEEPAVRFGL
ncbi:MAG: protein-disulfide isomerase [Patiriisocius sp.]|jgi:protein-disulfide isomerase